MLIVYNKVGRVNLRRSICFEKLSGGSGCPFDTSSETGIAVNETTIENVLFSCGLPLFPFPSASLNFQKGNASFQK